VQLAIDRCDETWVPDTEGYRCPGATTAISLDRPVQATISLNDSPAHQFAGVDHLRFTFRLPTTAPSSVEGTSGSVLIGAKGTT